MSLPTASFHTEFDASTILSGAVTRHSRHRAPSVAVAASAVTLSNIADRLIDECSTFSEIYYYEDADERQHPLFVQPPPTAEAPRESIDSQSTTQQHPSVYSSSAGEVSSAAALRTSSIDARTAALEAKLNLDALSAGRRPTPRLLSPADVEIDHARLPEVTVIQFSFFGNCPEYQSIVLIRLRGHRLHHPILYRFCRVCMHFCPMALSFLTHFPAFRSPLLTMMLPISIR
jgi:hypothetical protein